jgi:hypothetical protein
MDCNGPGHRGNFWGYKSDLCEILFAHGTRWRERASQELKIVIFFRVCV